MTSLALALWGAVALERWINAASERRYGAALLFYVLSLVLFTVAMAELLVAGVG